MARQKKTTTRAPVTSDYRYANKRKNVPPAAMAAEGTVPRVPKAQFEYSPHLPPVLRFDPTGKADALPELVAETGKRTLTAEEQKVLAEALRRHEPWLEWAGKRESDSGSNGHGYLEVDPVALHIHERISAQAVLRVAARQDVTRDLFADPQQAYKEAVQFYEHDVDWANRLILGDSLQVMSSLARREGLAGRVQMIYIDPPYGIKFASNFQSQLGRRDVKDKEDDLTREPEMVKAYRDTWSLGIHSYLEYLRDRLIAAKELLADSGSVFVQIGDENLHLIRTVLDQVFGRENSAGLIQFKKTGGFDSAGLPCICDYLVWYARSRPTLKFRSLFEPKVHGEGSGERYTTVYLPDGSSCTVSRYITDEGLRLPEGARLFLGAPLTSDGASTTTAPLVLEGRSLLPKPNQHWKTTPKGFDRLAGAGRLIATRRFANYRLFIDDFAATPISNMWDDTMGTAERDKTYVVQTPTKVIERCVLMTTDPGDLVLDPTCGSGTTAFVAEQWGRRWITVDTSRVAIAIARQRLLTARYDYFRLKNAASGPAGDFTYRTVPHVTLKSIAQNTNLDPVFSKHQPTLEAKLAAANRALGRVSDAVRKALLAKLWEKQRVEGKKAVTDSDRRRWELPKSGEKWEHWEVPFDTDPDWPKELQDALCEYRKVWRAKMNEVNACIAANAEQEELVDQPEVVRGTVRVSGPFTVEAVQPPEVSLVQPEFAGASQALEAGVVQEALPEYGADEATNTLAYLRQMFSLLKKDGVRFLGNREMVFSRLDPLFESGRADTFHAEGRWVIKGNSDSDPGGAANVGVVFGPEYGPVTALMVEEIIRPAARRYDDLVVAGFSFDGPAQQVIQGSTHPRLRIHMAHIRPDVNPGMAGLLKEQPGSQLFTVFGQPRVTPKRAKSGEWTVTMDGIDIYDPVKNVVVPTKGEQVAAWFLDGDYDGRTFCITQAFFPDKDAWAKLARALKGVLDEDRFAALSGTVSLPFPAGKYKRAAVKAIDPRGNEVMATLTLEG